MTAVMTRIGTECLVSTLPPVPCELRDFVPGGVSDEVCTRRARYYARLTSYVTCSFAEVYLCQHHLDMVNESRWVTLFKSEVVIIRELP